MTIPLGIQNNNPFNLEDSKIDWIGLAVPRRDSKGFLQFTGDFYGLRAGFISLKNAQVLHKRNTIREIVTAYAPLTKDGKPENDTEAYIKAVSLAMFGKEGEDNTPLDLGSRPVLRSLGLAIIHQEQGLQPYSDSLISKALDAALGTA